MLFLDKINKLLFSIYYLSSRGKTKFVFYSEKKNYRYYFITLINKLCSENKEMYYLSSDINDKFENENNKIKSFYIGTGFIRMIILSLIKCEYFFLTVTDLGNNEIHKNKKVKNYVYIFHALQSTHKIYTEKAFDNYDIICCNGPYQYEEIRLREKKFNLKEKKLIKSGYLYIEYLNKNLDIKKNDNYILFAPSWSLSDHNLLESFSIKILNKLLKSEFKVIFRPHQEHFKRSKKKLKDIFNQFENNSNLIIDEKPNNLESFEMSNFLISDYSGIVHEFLFTCKKPFLIFDDFKKIHNKNYLEIKRESFEEEIYAKFGHMINISNIENIEDHILITKKNFERKKIEIDNFCKQNIYTIDKSSEIIFDELII